MEWINVICMCGKADCIQLYGKTDDIEYITSRWKCNECKAAMYTIDGLPKLIGRQNVLALYIRYKQINNLAKLINIISTIIAPQHIINSTKTIIIDYINNNSTKWWIEHKNYTITQWGKDVEIEFINKQQEDK